MSESDRFTIAASDRQNNVSEKMVRNSCEGYSAEINGGRIDLTQAHAAPSNNVLKKTIGKTIIKEISFYQRGRALPSAMCFFPTIQQGKTEAEHP